MDESFSSHACYRKIEQPKNWEQQEDRWLEMAGHVCTGHMQGVYDAGSHPLDFPHGPIKRGTIMTLGVWLKTSQNNKILKHIVHTLELVSHNF